MKYVKNVNSDSSKIYTMSIRGILSTFRPEYDEETNIMSLPYFDEEIQYSGSGVYYNVRGFLSYDYYFTVKPELGEYVDDYQSVEFDTPDGIHFSGYSDGYGIFTGATTSSLVMVAEIGVFMISETPAYISYQCLQQNHNRVYDYDPDFHYKEFATDTGAEWIDGDGLYACQDDGNGKIFFVTNSSQTGKWEITEEEADVYYGGDEIKMKVLTNSKGDTMYYHDLQGTGVPQIFYQNGTYNDLPSVRTDGHILLEKHPKVVNYYEETVFPGVAYNKETKTVFYNNRNKKLYFVDNGQASSEVISALTFSELGITAQDVETYIEKIKEGYPADWFNIRINGMRLQDVEIRDGIITFFYYFDYTSSTGYCVSFNISTESCQFSRIMSDIK